MKILAIGDITSPAGVEYLAKNLWAYRRETAADLVIVNAENAGFLCGASPEQAAQLFDAGADVLTGGNHTLQNRSAYPALENDTRILRPCNYPSAVPGSGYTVLTINGWRVLVLSVLGVVHMEPQLDSPYHTVDRILKREEGHYDFAVVDAHAEATAEKMCLAAYLDGRVSVLFGTHTHVQTADERIWPRGCGYITDLGMCGPTDGILGVRTDVAVERSLTKLPLRFLPAEGPVQAQGALFTVEEATGRTQKVERVRF